MSAPITGGLPAMIAEDGSIISESLLKQARDCLSSASDAERKDYRDFNADAVAKAPAPQLLIVAGPGTGKSFLFLMRIREWIQRHPNQEIYVASFVRKLVKDLETEIKATTDLSDSQKALTKVTTLHGLARSLVEKNGGTIEVPFAAHVQMIAPIWQDVVWADVVALTPDIESRPSFNDFETQFHEDQLADEEQWAALRAIYFRLCQFYNAMGFADSIFHAKNAVLENDDLVTHRLWIIDEFQDFNDSEDSLIRTVTRTALGVLLAGDDDQALYQQLKSSRPDIIRSYYEAGDWVNAMLPLCSRSTAHIANAAASFIAAHRESGSIQKVYLPLKTEQAATPVQLVACTKPASAVDYIERFIEEHRAEIEERKAKIGAGKEKDPFLLILSHAKDLRKCFPKGEASRLDQLVAEWRVEDAGPRRDYYSLLTYYRVGQDATDNFALRKLLSLEGVPDPSVHRWLAEAMSRGVNLHEVVDPAIQASVARGQSIAQIVNDPDSDVDAVVSATQQVFAVGDPVALAEDLSAIPLGADQARLEDQEEDVETAAMISPVQKLTMVGSKGLSADHVMVVGCDDINMKKATPLAFFVAMTRARKSLHLISALEASGSTEPHEFLGSIPASCCEHTKMSKGRGFETLGSHQAFQRVFTKIAYGRRYGAAQRSGAADGRTKRERGR